MPTCASTTSAARPPVCGNPSRKPWIMRMGLTALGLLLAFGLFVPRAAAQKRPEKKFIQYGWGVPRPDFLREHIRKMEKRPFDGVIFRLKKYGNIFDTTPWDKEDLKKQTETLKAVEWDKFTDNFLCLYAANKQGMDWFNDEHWDVIIENLRLAVRAAKAARAKGICFDAEPYGANPWKFPGRYKDKSFAELTAKVHQRGVQFMEAMQQEMPDIHVLTLFMISHWREGKKGHLSLLDEPDPQRRLEQLSKGYYATLPAFFNGMLKVAGPEVRFTDGNESPSYYHKDAESYFRDYHRIKQASLSLIEAGNHSRYVAQMQAGMAIYMDYLLTLRPRPPKRPDLSMFLTPKERLLWLEHNVYWALTTSDRYVWCYSEHMDWWGTMAGQVKHGDWVPPGAAEAIRSARRKVKEGLPLGFNLDEIIAKAWAARKAYKPPAEKKAPPTKKAATKK